MSVVYVCLIVVFLLYMIKKAISQLVISHVESYSQDHELRLVAGQSVLLQHQVEPGLVELALHLFICLVGLPWAERRRKWDSESEKERALLRQHWLENTNHNGGFTFTTQHISTFLRGATYGWENFEHVGLLADHTPYFGVWSTLRRNYLRA